MRLILRVVAWLCVLARLAVGAPADRLHITSATSLVATQGQYFQYILTADPGPAAFKVANCPAGLSFSPADGVLSGVPAGAGEWNLLVMISRTNPPDFISQSLSLRVVNGSGAAFNPLTNAGSGGAPTPASASTNLPLLAVQFARDARNIGMTIPDNMLREIRDNVFTNLQKDTRFEVVSATNIARFSGRVVYILGVEINLRINVVQQRAREVQPEYYTYIPKADVSIQWELSKGGRLINKDTSSASETGDSVTVAAVMAPGAVIRKVAPPARDVTEEALEKGVMPYRQTVDEAMGKVLHQFSLFTLQ